MDDRAVAKLNAADEAADPGADLDLFHRLKPSGEFVPVGDGTSGRLRDRDWRRSRRRGSRLRRLFPTARQCEGNEDRQRRNVAQTTNAANDVPTKAL